MNHKQAQDLLPGYALGALEGREQENLLAHLQTCSACYQLAQGQVELSALMASRITEAEPPSALRARVQASIAEMSIPIEAQMAPERPSILERLGLSFRFPPIAAPAAGLAVLMLGAVLAYVVIAQGDLDGIRDENKALTAQIEQQGATVGASQAALAQLDQDNDALAAALNQQSAAVASSQGDLADLRQSNVALSSKLDEQPLVLASTQSSLADVSEVNRSLPGTLDGQDDALSKIRDENRAMAASLDSQSAALTQLQAENQSMASDLDSQSSVLSTSQAALDELRRDNDSLASQISDQDAVLATSQGDIENLKEENLALAARATDQQVFTYLQALPVTNKYVLKATADAPGTFGMLVTNVANNWGVAIVLGLDPLEPGTVYNLWLEKDGVATHGWFIKKVDPVTKFGQVYAKNFPTPVNQFDRLFITLEPLGGSPAPTGPALLSGNIS